LVTPKIYKTTVSKGFNHRRTQKLAATTLPLEYLPTCFISLKSFARVAIIYCSALLLLPQAVLSTQKSVCLSVCPSVCLSNTWIMIKRKKLMPTFLYHIKGPFI